MFLLQVGHLEWIAGLDLLQSFLSCEAPKILGQAPRQGCAIMRLTTERSSNQITKFYSDRRT